MNRTPFVLASILSLAPLVQAQLPTVVLSAGDTTPSGAVIDSIVEYDVDSSGRWVADIDVDPSPGTDHALISSDGGELIEGGPVPGMPGATVSSVSRIRRDGQGNVYCSIRVVPPSGVGTVRVIHRNFAAPLISDDDLLVGPDFGPNAQLWVVANIEVNEGGDLIAIGDVRDTSHTPFVYDAVVLFDLAEGVQIARLRHGAAAQLLGARVRRSHQLHHFARHVRDRELLRVE